MHCQFCLCHLTGEGVRGTSLDLVTAGKGECIPDQTSFLFLRFVWDGDPSLISDRLLFAVRQRGIFNLRVGCADSQGISIACQLFDILTWMWWWRLVNAFFE